MKKKMRIKTILISVVMTLSQLAFTQDLVLLKEFNINGTKELKKVRVKERNEFVYSNKPLMYSTEGRVTNLFFYDENGLLTKEWKSTSYYDNGLYWYEFNQETNLFELKYNDSREETLYFYDEKERLIRESVTGTNKFCEYSYDKKGNLIKKTAEWGSVKNKYNSKNQLTYQKYSDGSEYLYKYDNKNRRIYEKNLYNDGSIYEYYYEYDDVELTKTERKIKKAKDLVIFDFTDVYKYDSNGNLIYSKYYTGITTDSGNKLLSADLSESFYIYDEKGFLVYEKSLYKGSEENKYYEYLLDENKNINTSVCYEEVE